jgi:hypothetical protein
VADVVVCAVGGIEQVAAFEECFELGLQCGKVPDPCPDVSELGVDERDHVRAWNGPIVAKLDDAVDLGECEPGDLCHVDEAQPGERGFVVYAVAVGAPFGVGQEAPALIEPDGLAGHSDRVGKLTDQHFVHLSPLTFYHGTRFSVGDMDVCLLYFDDCPNWKFADQRLAAIAAERPDVAVTRHRVETAEEAERSGFHGSPSILVDGVDLFAEPDAGSGCRVGSTARRTAWAGAPTMEQLRDALGVAAEGA